MQQHQASKAAPRRPGTSAASSIHRRAPRAANTKDTMRPSSVDNLADSGPGSAQHKQPRVQTGSMSGTWGGAKKTMKVEVRTKENASGKGKEKSSSGTSGCKYCRRSNADLRRIIQTDVYQKYECRTQNTYNTNIVNDIVFNASSHIVAVFKDYLIMDDVTEFMKRSYPAGDSRERLRKLCTFYNQYSKVFANYYMLEEKKYMFKNIERKQKMIDEKQKALEKSGTDEANGTVFTQRFIDKLSDDTRSVLRESKVKKMGLEELVDRFIDRDSMSLVGESQCESVNIDVSFPAEKPVVQVQEKSLVRGLLSKAENARKKSLGAQQALASTRARRFISIPLEPTTNIHHIATTAALLSARHAQLPAESSSALMIWRLQKPNAGPSQNERRAGAQSQRGGRRAQPGKNSSGSTPRRIRPADPLNININLNFVWNSNRGGLAPQSCTAATQGMLMQQICPSGFPAARPLRFSGSTPRPRLERVLSNPSIVVRSQRNFQRRAAESVRAVYSGGASPTEKGTRQTKSRSGAATQRGRPVRLIVRPEIGTRKGPTARKARAPSYGGAAAGRRVLYPV